MTQTPLESPADRFLAQDPHAAFLASGDPQRFLADNLPSVGDDEQEGKRKGALVLGLALGIAGAFIAWRYMAARRLSQMPPPTPRDDLASRLQDFSMVDWMAAAVPELRQAFIRDHKMSVPMAEAAASAYAAQLGKYVHETSADALVRGYTAELNRGVAPEVAWARASMGYGLTNRQMRQWMAGFQKMTGYVDEVAPTSMRRVLDKAILQRADDLGQTEAWQARQIGRSIVWMQQLRTGQLPETARKRWLTARDELVCGVCGPLDEQEVGINERFQLPGASVWAPGVHPNCRCELELVRPVVGIEKIAKVISTDSKKAIQDNVTTGGVLTPAGRKKLVTEVVVTEGELQARRRARRLRRVDPMHPSVRGKILKARGDDPYDRDAKGRFAATEARLSPINPPSGGGIGLLDRPEPQAQVAEPEQSVSLGLDETLGLDLAPDLGLSEQISLGLDEALDLGLDQETSLGLDTETSTLGLDATPQVGTGSGQLIIIIGGRVERQPPGDMVLADFDVYQAVMNEHAFKLKDPQDRFGEYGIKHPWERYPDREFGTDEIRVRPQDIMPQHHLYDEITADDIGKIIDFDVWNNRMRVLKKDPDYPGFPARQVADHLEMVDMVTSVAEDPDEIDQESQENYDMMRSEIADAYFQGAEVDIPLLTKDQFKVIFSEAGYHEEAKVLSAEQMADRLMRAVLDGYDDDIDLAYSYIEFMLQRDPDVQSMEAKMGSKLGHPDGFTVVPQMLSFRTGSLVADRQEGKRDNLLLHGKYRIVAIKTHSFTADELMTKDTRTGRLKARPVTNPGRLTNPRIPKWREIILERVDD